MSQNNIKPIEQRSITAEIRAAQEGRIIEGYAAKFDKWSDPIWGFFREKIARGAFDGCDMTDVIACFNHDISRLFARTSSGTLKLTVDAIGLFFQFEVPNTTDGNDLLEMVRRGDISQCSFKFWVETAEWTYRNEENGLEYDECVVTQFEKLFDVSLVTYPAYPDTEAKARYMQQRAEATEPPAAEDSLEAQVRARKTKCIEMQTNS